MVVTVSFKKLLGLVTTIIAQSPACVKSKSSGSWEGLEPSDLHLTIDVEYGIMEVASIFSCGLGLRLSIAILGRAVGILPRPYSQHRENINMPAAGQHLITTDKVLSMYESCRWGLSDSRPTLRDPLTLTAGGENTVIEDLKIIYNRTHTTENLNT